MDALEMRRQRITDRVAAGEPITKVAADEGISRQRVSQIIHERGLFIGQSRIAVQQRREASLLAELARAGATLDELVTRSGRSRTALVHTMRSLGVRFPRKRVAQHGTHSKYNAGCRCEPCREGHNESIKGYQQKNPERARASIRAYQRRHPDRVRAYRALNNAVKTGTTTKPDRCACGRAARVSGHHDDYSKPLDVMWLCGVCHKARHAMLRQAAA